MPLLDRAQLADLCALGILAAAASARAQNADALGGPGESCRARSDCRAGLKCIQQVCVDSHEGESCNATSECGGELRCVAHRCVTPNASVEPGPVPDAPAPSPQAGSSWARFKLHGAHPFVGLTWQAGTSYGAIANDQAFVGDSAPQGSALFGIRAGLYVGKQELAVEVTPAPGGSTDTFVPS